MDGAFHSIARDRVLVLDIIRIARKVPSFPVEKEFSLGEVADLRQSIPSRVSWVSLFAKAYALVAAETPELRRCYVSWPWPRFYQESHSVITVSINRKTERGERLFFGRIGLPDQRSLIEIQAELERYNHSPIEEVFGHQVKAAMLPGPLRRLALWWRMQIDIRNRARRMGTGSISVLASEGVTNKLHPCILSSSLSYGPIDSAGRMIVTLQCDHRVIDGMQAARAINALERIMKHEIREELQSIKQQRINAA